ncbi:Hypothetical predicted protein [Octopus vulgaris]|uniref:Uncharacterized protein n=1 Tax=Octopus vulgaris TaxID=6645 RepID=A0AA36B3Q3_OCTVU|nr:Hypothetical predicted protein [Octopus vulgaris]
MRGEFYRKWETERTIVAGFNKKNSDRIIYTNIPSAIRPVSHSDNIPIFLPPETWKIPSWSDTSVTNAIEVDYEPPTNDDRKLFNEVELNYSVRDFHFPRESAQLLDSRLKEHRLLASGTLPCYRHREEEFTQVFEKQDSLVSSSKLSDLIEHMEMSYKTVNGSLKIKSILATDGTASQRLIILLKSRKYLGYHQVLTFYNIHFI